MAKLRIITILTLAFSITLGAMVQVSAATVDEWLKDSDGKNEEKNDETTPAEPDSEPEQNNTDSAIESNGPLLFDLVKMFFALILVLALIYLLLKFLNKRNKLFQQVRALENLGGISVGQNKSIQIVRIGQRFYLIGVGDNVQMLQEITDDDVITDLLEAENAEKGSLTAPFFRRKANNSDQIDFKNMFSAELAKLKQTRNKIINNKTKKDDEHE